MAVSDVAVVFGPAEIRPEVQAQRILFALLDAGRQVKADMAAKTATWLAENQPVWMESAYASGSDYIWEYTTRSFPFIWVDVGTPAHVITASPWTGSLIFKQNFIPKTFPRAWGSAPGARWGEWVRKQQVMHPGGEPREISAESAKRAGRVLASNLNTQLVTIY